MTRLERFSPTHNSLVSRRSLILGAFAGAALFLTGSEGVRNALPAKDTLIRLHPIPYKPERVLSFNGVDSDYLHKLLSGLQANEDDRFTKVEAVRNSLRVVEQRNDPEIPPFRGTALQLDESGIYLTANHLALYSTHEALGQYMLTMVDPISGDSSRVQAAIKHPDADIAIVFAPTGKPKQPTPNLGICPRQLDDEESLWMLGFTGAKDRTLSYVIKKGSVELSVNLPAVENVDKNFPSFRREKASRIAVRGLIPFGGTSGSPIVDEKGDVVAVESGFYPNGAKTLDQYEGAVIIPLTYLSSLGTFDPLFY